MKQSQNIRDEKRSKFETAPQEKRSVLPVIALVGILIVAAGAVWGLTRADGNSASETASSPVADGALRFPLSTFDDGQAHFYHHEIDGKKVEFFVLKSSDGVVRAAFNACDVCFLEKKGYRQEGDQMVCNNCGQRFPSHLINEVRGGCNPSPLERSIQGDELVIQVDDIAAGARYF